MSEHEPESWIRHRNRARARRRKRTENLPTGPRTRRIVVRVSPEEQREIQAQAQAGGVTAARLMRDAVLHEDPPFAAEEMRELTVELFHAQTALRTVAGNLNQMTRATNATGQLADELTHTLDAVRRYADRISAAVDRLTP